VRSDAEMDDAAERDLVILGLSWDEVTTAEINKAFKRWALSGHPDKQASSSAEVIADATERFQRVSAARDRLLQVPENVRIERRDAARRSADCRGDWLTREREAVARRVAEQRARAEAERVAEERARAEAERRAWPARAEAERPMSVSSSDDCSVDGAAASSSSPSAAAPGRHPSSSSAPTPAPGLGPAGRKAPPPQPSGQPGRAAAAPLSPCEVVHDVVKKRVADADRADGWLSPLCAPQ